MTRPAAPMRHNRFVLGLPRGSQSLIMYESFVHVIERHGATRLYYFNRASEVLFPISDSHGPAGAEGRHYQPG